MDITTDGSEHVSRSTMANRLGISVDKLDFGYIESCKNAEELEKILKLLRSGEEGCFPDLENKAEERLQSLKPKSRLLRKEDHVLKASDLRPEESSAVKEDLSNWARDMSLKDQQLKQEPQNAAPSRPISKELPPVRNANASSIKPSSKRDNEVISNRTSQKPPAPRNYREWDKVISTIDTEVEVPDLSTSSPATLASASAKLSKSEDLNHTIDSTGMSDVQKEQLSILEKDKGNEALRAGSFTEATIYYCRSISVLPTVAAHNNRALAYIKLEKWTDAISDCNYVLSRESQDIKALLRRATAFRGQRKYNEAKADIDVVLAYEPNNKQAQELLTSISKHVVKEESQGKPGVPRRMVIEETDGEDTDDEMSSTVVDSNESRGSGVSEPTELSTTSQEPPCVTASSGRVVEGAEGKDGNKPRQPHFDLSAPAPSIPAMPDRQDSTTVALDLSNANPSVPATSVPVVDPDGKSTSSTTDQPVKIVVAPLPSNVAALSSKAGALFKAGQYGDAKGLYDQAITALGGGDIGDLGPMHANSYHLSSLCSNRAACYFKMGDPRKCVSDCTAALQLAPHSPRALLRRAQAYEQLEKFSDAYVDYRHYLSRITVDGSVGDVTTAHQGASRCQVCLQQLHGYAWRDRIPKIPSVSNLLAYEFESSEDGSLERSPAGESFNEPAIGDNNTETGEPAQRYTTYDSAKNDGNDFFKKGNYQEAIKCYTAGIKLAPNQAVCYSNRAECFLKLNQLQPAADDADTALRFDPDNVKALFRCARACKGLGQLSKSRELTERLLQLDRNNKEAQKELQAIIQALSAKDTTEVTDKNYQSSVAKRSTTAGMRVKIDETTSDESDTETASSSAGNSSSEGSAHAKSLPDRSASRTVNGQTAVNESQIAFNDKPNLEAASRVYEDFHTAQDTSGQKQPTAVLLKGQQLFDAGLFDEATDVYSGAINSYQGIDIAAAEANVVSSLYYGRASCHLEKHDPVACLADCESALKLSPADDRPAQLRQRAATLLKQTDRERTDPAASFQSTSMSEPLPTANSSAYAREHAHVVGSSGPCDAKAESSSSLTLGYEEVKEKGRKLVAEGNFQKALELYSAGICKFGADPVLHNNRAFCHLRLEHFAEAVADCNAVLQSEPNNTKALFRLGRAEKCRGNYQSSMRTLNQALQLDKCNKEITQELDSVKELYRRHLEGLKNNGSASTTCSKDSPSGGLSACSKSDVKSTPRKTPEATAGAALHRVGASGDASTTNQSRAAAETADEAPARDRCCPLSHRKPTTGTVGSTMVNADATPSCPVPSYGNGSVRSDDSTDVLREQVSVNGSFDIPKRPVQERARSGGARKPVRVTPSSFVQEWHRIKSLKETLPYADLLRKISPGDIPEAITNQIDGDMLSKVVSTLKDHFISCGEDSRTAYDILENISRVSRFNMAKEFLSSSDKRNLDEIMKAFTHCGLEMSATSVLRRSYGL